MRVVVFGVAFAFDRLTRTTGFAPKGTNGYMTPEQVLGTLVDRRADVFALGCTHTMSWLTLASRRPAIGRGTETWHTAYVMGAPDA